MVSMVIQLFEEKLEEFMAELINRIQEDYRENLARARETEEDLDEDKIEKEKDDPKATVKNLFNSSLQNKVVSLFLKDKQLITLLEKVEASSNMVSKSTQTEKPKPPSNPRWNI